MTPQRPVQYKPENRGCGFRCGLGCEEPLRGGVNDGMEGDIETDSTAVESLSDMSRPTSQEGDFVDSEGARWQGTSTMPEEYDETVSHVHQWEGSFSQTLSSQDYDNMPGSLGREPYAAEDHSPMTSNRGSDENVSPYPDFEYVIRGLPPVQLHPTYLFLASPLWLSPQLEHCRGI